MSIFFTADTHFGHVNILHHANRPFATIKEHDDYLIEQWNNMVHPGDMIYVLGDFAWRDHAQYRHALHGKVVLIKGSHDRMSQDVLRLFTEVHDGMLIRNFDKHLICMTHCAMLVWESSHYGAINLYAHSHGRIRETDDRRRMDIGVDVWQYRPVPLELILAIMDKRTFGYKGTGDEANENVRLLEDRNRNFRASVHVVPPAEPCPIIPPEQSV